MEKKRRARINDSLNELKRILLESSASMTPIGGKEEVCGFPIMTNLTYATVRKFLSIF